MIHLPNVTLCIADCVDRARSDAAISRSIRDIDFGAILKFSNTPSHVCEFTPRNIDSLGEYSRFILHDLAGYVKTSHALIIQHDGYALKADAWQAAWLEYDYIGAPWWYTDGMNVGNGGFSLRSKKLLDITAAEKWPVIDNEDHMICRLRRHELELKHGIRFAPEEVAERFSVEGTSGNRRTWTGQFGFHNFSTDISKAG
jgi:hypothetical protein